MRKNTTYKQSYAFSLSILLTATCFITTPAKAQDWLGEYIKADYPLSRPLGLKYQPLTNFQERKTTSTKNSELHKKLTRLNDDFRYSSERIKRSEDYISALEEILSTTKFSSILKCRDQVVATQNISYSIKIMDSVASTNNKISLMRVQPEHLSENSNGIRQYNYTLYFNAEIDPTLALTTYLHEIFHLCRTPERIKIEAELEKRAKELITEKEQDAALNWGQGAWESLGAESAQKIRRFDKARERVYQNIALAEIEANFVQQIAASYFSQFISVDTIYDNFEENQKSIEDGSFAQRIMHLYLGDEVRQKNAYFFDPSDKRNSMTKYEKYDANPLDVIGKISFSMRKLNPELKSAILSLGISVND